MNGFLLIDKETGINSFKLVIVLRKLADQKRVGFAGTLDPLATGLMILALGEYTKLLPYLEKADKKYEVEMQMGKVSDTYDMDGEVSDVADFDNPNESEILRILNEKFLGKIEQIPPRFSAVKVDGKRAYDMARAGEKFELKSREVEVFSVEILEYNFPVLRLRIHCSSGTYIRSIVHDLGQILGCGGVVSALRRIAISKISVDEKVVKIFDLSSENLEQFFVSPRELFKHMMQIDLNQEEYNVMASGNFVDDRFDVHSVALGFLGGELVGVFEKVSGLNKLKFKKKLNIF